MLTDLGRRNVPVSQGPVFILLGEGGCTLLLASDSTVPGRGLACAPWSTLAALVRLEPGVEPAGAGVKGLPLAALPRRDPAAEGLDLTASMVALASPVMLT